MNKLSLILFTFFYLLTSFIYAANPSAIQWNAWSDANFQKAKKENRFVILDLEAVWCHWCHVMNAKTYDNPAIISMIQQHFIAVKVDQDSRPDLSNLYQDYGWPATIIFNADGQAVEKLAGYIPPDQMLEILKSISVTSATATKIVNLKQPTEIVNEDPFLSNKLRDQMIQDQSAIYDDTNKGWGGKNGGQKYLDPDVVEYAITQAQIGNTTAVRMAQETLQAQQALVDPVWGGMYQYSTNGNWAHPHFEKIMWFQTEDMRIYAEAYALWHNPVYLQTAEKIYYFLIHFLMSPDGVFFTSMDADLIDGVHSAGYFKLDDAQRRKEGVPHVDQHIYARENGWVINALATLYMATGNTLYLNLAKKAADWIIQNRSLPNGGFSHDTKDISGPYLGDTLSMGRAFLALYQATGDRQYLVLSEKALNFINVNFNNSTHQPGYVTAVPTGEMVLNQAQPDREENVMLTRYANLLYQYTGNKTDKDIAQNTMRYLASPNIARDGYPAPVLLADYEITHDPLHITIVGDKDNKDAQTLYLTGLKFPSSYKRIEWWDTREGLLPNPDVEYPPLDKAGSFVCVNHRCSLPAFNANDLQQLIEKLDHNKAAVIDDQSRPLANVVSKPVMNIATQQDTAEELLTNKSGWLIFIGFLVFGIFLSLTPCVLPMIPILVSIIAGQGNALTTRRAFSLSLTYVLAMSFTYACAGVIAGLAGSYVQAYLQNIWALSAFSLIFVLLAFSLFGFYELQLPSRFQQRITNLSYRQPGGTYLGVAIMGVLTTLIASPCVTAPLIGVLSYIAKTGNAVLGGFALFVMGLGIGIPLLIVGTLGGKFLPKSGPWLNSIKFFFGFLLLGLAIWIIQRVIPAQLIMFLWASLAIGIALFMGALSSKPKGFKHIIWKLLSVIILIYGLALIFSAVKGNTDPLKLFAFNSITNTSTTQLSFQNIKNVTELNHAVAIATSQHKPVMLDFYASWCTACKEMEKNTFADPKVQKQLEKFILLRADLTNVNGQGVSLAKQFGVIAPPATLFFDASGQLLQIRVFGDVGPKTFLNVLKKF